MVRQKLRPYKPPKKSIPKEKRSSSPLIWYGGKSRDADAIISQFPQHNTYVEGFGGGGSVLFRKDTSIIDIYNDFGEVANFFKVMREHGELLYEKLYLTPYSKEEFETAKEITWTFAQLKKDGNTFTKEDIVEWARCFYVRIMQSFTHEENASSWKPSKTMDLAHTWNNHVEDLPRFIERLRKVVIEHRDVMEVLKMYDSEKTLFYLDPPYVEETRKSANNYVHEMPIDKHEKMLIWLTTELKGQCIVSMYDHALYNKYLAKWRRVEIDHLSMIHNSSTKEPGTRKEVLWIKEFHYGLWSFATDIAQANVAGIFEENS